jgi:lipopolysaccharide biosynthesis protein
MHRSGEIAMVNDFINAFRRFRKALKAKLPYVRKREYRILRVRHDALIDALTVGARPASDAGFSWIKPFDGVPGGEVCLFVTHAARPVLKPHVLHHLTSLVGAGFAVVLVINTDLDRSALSIPPALAGRLAACLVRENVGFDFAAWGHVYVLGQGFPAATRLLLVNDSVIGPLDDQSFAEMIGRLRSTAGDVVGLTENAVPHRHLQSYFLSFGPRALQSDALRAAFLNMHSLPTKELVIDAYETALTRQLSLAGLSVSALFPPLYNDPRSADDTLIRWRELIDAGLPYVKASLLTSTKEGNAVRATIPAVLLADS